MDDELLEFQKYLDLECNKILKDITKDAENTLKQRVQIDNRKSYNPKIYHRKGLLKNNISSETNDHEGVIYWKDLEYTNFAGEEVEGNDVVGWVNRGFGSSPYNYKDSRPAQNFIEKTCDIINEKYKDYGDSVCKKIGE